MSLKMTVVRLWRIKDIKEDSVEPIQGFKALKNTLKLCKPCIIDIDIWG